MRGRLDRWILLPRSLVAAALLLAVASCAEPPPAPTPTPPPTHAPAPKRVPPPFPYPPTPAQDEIRLQTPTDFGSNTRVVDGDIHVWHIPACPPVPPATWVAPIILTDLRSGSQLHLDPDGSIMESPAPVYRSDEGRDRFAEVLEDDALMELILAPMVCP